MSVPRKSREPSGSVSCLWRNARAAEPFRTGVSLHSHTYHRGSIAILPLSGLWPTGGPRLVRWFLAWVEFLATPRIRGTLRWALGEQGEIRA
jgi:hypothetical protein